MRGSDPSSSLHSRVDVDIEYLDRCILIEHSLADKGRGFIAS
jgi:hypothetical protein